MTASPLNLLFPLKRVPLSNIFAIFHNKAMQINYKTAKSSPKRNRKEKTFLIKYLKIHLSSKLNPKTRKSIKRNRNFYLKILFQKKTEQRKASEKKTIFATCKWFSRISFSFLRVFSEENCFIMKIRLGYDTYLAYVTE